MTLATKKAMTSVLILAALAGAGFLYRPGGAGTEEPEAPPNPAAATAPVDALGDPLPPGALARLGSNRFHHGENIRRVFVSPDGRRVLSLSRTNEAWKAKLWEAATGRALPLGDGKLASDEVLAAGPAGRGLALVIRTAAGLSLVDAETGLATIAVPGTKAYVPAIRPDGKAVAYMEQDNGYAVRLWQTGAVHSAEIIPPQPDAIHRLLFSADGRRLAVYYLPDGRRPLGARGQRTEVWDVATAKMLLLTQDADMNTEGVDNQALALSADGKLFAKSERDKKRVRLWEVDGGKELAPLVWSEGDGCWAFSFAPDGKSAVTATMNVRGYQVWDLASHKQVGGVRGLGSDVWDVAWSPDGKQVVAAHGDDVIVRDAGNGAPAFDIVHPWIVYRLAWSPDGKRVTTYVDKPRAWDAATGRPVPLPTRPGVTGPWAAETLDGSRAARAVKDGKVQVWDTATGKDLAQLAVADGYAKTLATAQLVALTQDGQWLAAAGQKTVQVWNVARAERVMSVQHELSEVSGMWFAPEGKRIAVTGRVADTLEQPGKSEYALAVWAVPAGDRLVRLPLGGDAPQDLSLDGRFLLACRDGRQVQLWDVAARSRRFMLASSDREVMFARFSPNGRSVAVGFRGPDVLVVETASGGRRFTFDAQTTEVGFGAAFSPDGARLATGAGNAVLIWDVSGAGDRRLPKTADDAWADMASPDAAKGFAAVRYFAAHPDSAVRFVGERVKLVPVIDPKEAASQLANLDADAFADREAAQKWLLAAAANTDAARSQVRKALESTKSLEAHQRLEAILGRVDGQPLAGDALRAVRAVEALERAGAPASRAALERLAGGAADAWLTREAVSALSRLPRF